MDQMGTGPEVTVIGTGLADGGTLTVAGREALAGIRGRISVPNHSTPKLLTPPMIISAPEIA